MKYEYTGEVECVQETQTVGANFQKRDLVCREELGRSGKMQFLPFTFTRDNVTKLDGINPGDRVKIGFYLDGSKVAYNGRYFAQFTGVEVTVISAAGSAPASATPSNPPAPVHVQGATMDNAVGEWKKWKGDSKEAIGEFGKFCQGLKPGKASKDYTAADWGDIVNAIRDAVAKTVAGGASSPSQSPDDIGW